MDKTKTNVSALNAAQVETSRLKHGDNSLTKQKQKSFVFQFFANLNDPVIRILLCALAVNTFFAFRNGNWPETAGIAVAVFLAAFISTLSEYSSAAAFSRLESNSDKAVCRVRRSDGISEIPLREAVVGDIVLLSAGELIPADGLLLSGRLTVDQSAMTGESAESEKLPTKSDERNPANKTALFRGCAVLSGEGEMLVTAVGDLTFLGEISREIQQSTRESPLRIRLTRLARQISKIGYIMASLVALAYLFNVFILDSGFQGALILMKLGNPAYLFQKLLAAFTLGLTVLVMAVPEGLPMMIAVVLSSNLRKMMRDNVLVRKPVGIEAAGSMNILFTDKTGTLTEGKPSITMLLLGNGDKLTLHEMKKNNSRLNLLFRLSCLYNTSSQAGADGKTVGGNAADRIFFDAVKSWGNIHGYKAISRIPFDSAKKTSSATLSGAEELLLLKGASEKLLPSITTCLNVNGERTPLDASFSYKLEELTHNGGRLLLLTYREQGTDHLTLICGVQLSDCERPEANDAVHNLHNAGIQVVMITGDNRETARHIAQRCGIITDKTDLCLTSDEMARLSDLRLRELLPRLAVVARALPVDKSRLVRIAQESGLVVGMTGDGVNDAPALRHADVGFAMGSGTQVAKEAGDIVILDNNLASIVKAVLYGRTVFKSIRKFITLQLTMNLCACGVSMIGPFIGIDAPVTVLQMLWINMIMDTLGGLAFAGEPPRKRYLSEKPKRRDEPILNGYMVNALLFHGTFTLALCIAFLKLPGISSKFRTSEGSLCLLTAFFAFFIISSVLNCLNARTDRLNLFCDIRKNKVFLLIMTAICVIQLTFIYLGGSVLRTMPLTPQELGWTLLFALAVIPAEFFRKLLWRLAGKKYGY